jgi:hypothetical protein
VNDRRRRVPAGTGPNRNLLPSLTFKDLQGLGGSGADRGESAESGGRGGRKAGVGRERRRGRVAGGRQEWRRRHCAGGGAVMRGETLACWSLLYCEFWRQIDSGRPSMRSLGKY